MKKVFLMGLGGVIVGGLALGMIYRKNLAGVRPIFQTPELSIVDILEKNTSTSASIELPKVDFPLHLLEGFQIGLLAKNVSNARVLFLDNRGNLWASRTKDGIVTRLDIENGVVVKQTDVFKHLSNPHGLAFDPKQPDVLYIAEENKISRVEPYSDNLTLQKVVDLPGTGRHFTRTLLFDNDGNLFVSIGSTCDVCNESDTRMSTVMKVVFDNAEHTIAHLEDYARGLRNSVFLAVHPTTGNIWATDMGRDNLGDNIPPDEVNIIEQNKNYGWPICYGKNQHDTVFDKKTYIRNPCMEPFETPSYIDLQAHSAALGLAFIPAHSAWPQEYWNNLLIAYHGSWNRTVPTGYKIVRYQLDDKGNPKIGSAFVEEDFISGWLKGGKESYGRPVDILAHEDGYLYISDDKAGVIYKVSVKK